MAAGTHLALVPLQRAALGRVDEAGRLEARGRERDAAAATDNCAEVEAAFTETAVQAFS